MLLPGSFSRPDEKAFLAQERSRRRYLRSVGDDRLGRTLVRPLRSPSARVCPGGLLTPRLHQSWTQPRGARSSETRRSAASPRGPEPAASDAAGWRDRTAPDSSSNEESHSLLHLTVRSNISLLVSNIWERRLIESLGGKNS